MKWLPLCLLLLPPAAVSGEEGEEGRPPVGVTVRAFVGGSVTEAVLPGELKAWDVRTTPAGNNGIFLLVAAGGDPEGPRQLYRLHLEGEPRLGHVHRSLPDKADSLEILPDGSLLVGDPGGLGLLPFGSESVDPLRPALAPGLEFDLRRRPERVPGFADPVAADLYQATVGRLQRLVLRDSALVLDSETALPVRARRAPGELWLWTPKVTLLARPGAPPLYAVGPEPLGSRRLRTVLIDPALEGEDAVGESWAALPGAEVVQKSWFLWLDGRPYLGVATGRAEGFGVFEKQQVRVYALAADRTRTGRTPVLETKTSTHRWQWLDLQTTDFDGDGREDLAVLQTDGIGAGKFVIEVFFGNGSGGFDLRPARTGMEVAGRRWALTPDLTGDGAADLLGVTSESMLIFGSRQPARRRQVVDKKPVWEIPGDSNLGELDTEVVVGDQVVALERGRMDLHQPRLVDLDGDGKLEIVLAAGQAGGRDVVRVVDFDE